MTKLRKIPQRLADELLAPSFRDTTYRAGGVIFLKYQAPCRMWQVQVFMLNYHSRCSQGCLLGQWWGCSEISHSMKGFMDTGVGAFPWAKTECKYSFILKVTRGLGLFPYHPLCNTSQLFAKKKQHQVMLGCTQGAAGIRSPSFFANLSQSETAAVWSSHPLGTIWQLKWNESTQALGDVTVGSAAALPGITMEQKAIKPHPRPHEDKWDTSGGCGEDRKGCVQQKLGPN